MIFELNIEELKTKISELEKACKNEIGKMKFSLIAQIGLSFDEKSEEDKLILIVGTLDENEHKEVSRIISKRKYKEFDNRLHAKHIIIDGMKKTP